MRNLDSAEFLIENYRGSNYQWVLFSSVYLLALKLWHVIQG